MRQERVLSINTVAYHLENQIRDEVNRGTNLTQANKELQRIGFQFENNDPRHIRRAALISTLEREYQGVGLNFESLKSLADSLFHIALKYIQTESSFSGLKIEEQRLLAAYWSADYWYYLKRTFTQPILFRENHGETELAWPSFNPVFAHKPAHPARLDSRSIDWYVRSEEESIQDRVAKLIEKNGTVHITDVGMGEGRVVKYLIDQFGSNVVVTGVTVDNVMVPGVDVICSPAEFLSQIPSNSQDLVLSNYASCYFLWPDLAYQHILRIMKPGGTGLLDIASSHKVGAVTTQYEFMASVLGHADWRRVLTQLEANFYSLRYQKVEDYLSELIAPAVGAQVVIKPALMRDGYGRGVEVRKMTE